MRFSQRMGLRPVRAAIQLDSMDDDLRNGLWNVFHAHFVQPLLSQRSFRTAKEQIDIIWSEFLKEPLDEAPDRFSEARDTFKPIFSHEEYLSVYDLVDFTVQASGPYHRSLEEEYNAVLEKEVAGYRFISGLLSPISDQVELASIEESIGGPFRGAGLHLRRALSLLSDREAPDFRNSIKESILAVESVARVVTGKEKATLGDLLPMLKNYALIHPAQKEAFSRLYGYTSDEGGIRHAMLDEPNLGFSEAKHAGGLRCICELFGGSDSIASVMMLMYAGVEPASAPDAAYRKAFYMCRVSATAS